MLWSFCLQRLATEVEDRELATDRGAGFPPAVQRAAPTRQRPTGTTISTPEDCRKRSSSGGLWEAADRATFRHRRRRRAQVGRSCLICVALFRGCKLTRRETAFLTQSKPLSCHRSNPVCLLYARKSRPVRRNAFY